MGDSLGTSVNMMQSGSLPWQPMRNQEPSKVNYTDYATNPSTFNSGVDYDALARQAKTSQSLNAGNKMSQLQARYAGSGMRRADVGTGMREIAADSENAQNNADLAMQQAKLSDQMGLMEAYNRALERSNKLKESNYNQQYESYNNEMNRRLGLNAKQGEQQHKLGGSFLSMIGGGGMGG